MVALPGEGEKPLAPLSNPAPGCTNFGKSAPTLKFFYEVSEKVSGARKSGLNSSVSV